MKTNQNQADIFSMFGIEDEYAEKLKREESERQKRAEEAKIRAEELKKASAGASTSTNAPKKKEPEVFDVNVETFVYHLGQELPLTNYFTVEEILQGLPSKKQDEEEPTLRKITGEDVRKRLEKEFPDLLAAYTDMAFVKQKNMILAVPKARKKGLEMDIDCTEESSKEDSLHYRKKIPFSILSDFISLSNQFSTKYGVELHGDIYFDLNRDEFFMDIPHQVASSITVERIQDVELTLQKLNGIRFLKIMEIHSHHVMEPFPSRLDDYNERQGGVLYAIVGNVDKFLPDITLRRFDPHRDRHIDLDPNLVFESPFESLNKKYDTSLVEVC